MPSVGMKPSYSTQSLESLLPQSRLKDGPGSVGDCRICGDQQAADSRDLRFKLATEFLSSIRLTAAPHAASERRRSLTREQMAERHRQHQQSARKVMSFATSEMGTDHHLSTVILLPHVRSETRDPFPLCLVELSRERSAMSHADLLEPTTEEQIERRHQPLDDAEMEMGRVRTVHLVLGGVITSIAPYVRQKDLKEAMNALFVQRFPHIRGEMTLSKLRSLKRRMGQLCFQRYRWTPPIGREHTANTSQLVAPYTIAAACSYLETLMDGNLVAKDARRQVAGACVLLAVKLYEPYFTQKIPVIIPILAKALSVPADRIVAAEVPVWTELGFRLMLDEACVEGQIQRLRDVCGITKVHDDGMRLPPRPNR